MRTTFDLPEALLDEIKRRALDEGRDVSELVAQLLAASMSHVATSATANGATVPKTLPLAPVRPIERPDVRIAVSTRLVKDPKTGFPLIVCGPNAPASKMTAAELIALEQQSQLEEDLERIGLSR
jgi:hypothetical protein